MPRNPVGAPQFLADALLRSASGASATLQIAGSATDSTQLEMGIAPTVFSEVIVGPAVLRKVRPSWQKGDESEWELLLSATSVEQQLGTLALASAQALFAMTLAVTVAGQNYLIETVAANEAFGQVYLYRLLLREARTQAL